MPSPSSPLTGPSIATIGGAMTISEFCDWARVGKTKLYAEVKAGRIVLRKIGSKSVILRNDGERWLHSLPTATAIEELGKPRRSTSDGANEPLSSAKSELGHQGADLDAEVA